MFKKFIGVFVALVLTLSLASPARALTPSVAFAVWNTGLGAWVTIWPDGNGEYNLIGGKKYRITLSGSDTPYDQARFDIEMASTFYTLWHTTTFGAYCSGTCNVVVVDATQRVINPVPAGANYINSAIFTGTVYDEPTSGQLYWRVDKDGQAEDIIVTYNIS